MKYLSLYFDVVRVDADRVMLIFNGPNETKMAFRAIMSMVAAAPGISLEIKPSYRIVLNSMAWNIWREVVTPYTKEINSGNRYVLTLSNGRITRRDVIYPIMLRRSSAIVVA